MTQIEESYATIETLHSSFTRRPGRRVIIIAVVLVALIGVFMAVNLLGRETVVRAPEPPVNNSISAEEGLASAVLQFDETIPVDKGLPDIHVTSALVKELDAQQALFVYRPRARWPIASITKLMTAVVALEELGPTLIVPMTQEAIETEGEAGLAKVGERYTVTDLIKMMLLVSSNDAATALAHAYDKKQLGEEAYNKAINKAALFTARMQERARALGMEDTYFGDPSGLSMVNQSVVGDLAILVRHIQGTQPTILEIARQKQSSVLDHKKMARRTLTSINQFAGQKDFLGGKTGFTDEAGQNLVSLFSYKGKKYLIVVLGTEDRFGETTKLYEWLKRTVGQ